MNHVLTVREINATDIPFIIRYWLGASKEHLESMGVDIAKLPTEEQFNSYLNTQLELPASKKEAYCIIWEKDGVAIGHSNTRPTVFAEEAFMHLHMWSNDNRNKGMGYEFIRLSIPYFFRNLQLQNLYCEPYALNPAPNKTIAKAGFELVQEQLTVPGAFNFEQSTKLWKLTREKFTSIYASML